MPQIPKHRLIGPGCRIYRKAAGLSQLKVAHGLGYSCAQLISNFERGTCSLPKDKLFEYAKICKIPRPILVALFLADQLYLFSEDV